MPYIVQPGDTLYTIAQKFNTTVEALLAANRLSSSFLIYPGQLLEIPKECENGQLGFYYIVQPGDSLYRIAQRFNVPLSELIRVNQIPPPYTIFLTENLCSSVEAPKPSRRPGIYRTAR